MDVLEFIFWSGCVGLFLAGAVMELLKITIKAARKERAWKKEYILYGKTKRK